MQLMTDLLNALDTMPLAGVILWALVENVVLFAVVTVAGVILWRAGIIHRTHHLYENPRPLTLFVLNPFEVLGFGALAGCADHLSLRRAGHLSVEPMPRRWIKTSLARYISTSTFHAEHHLDKDHNYGFYTLIWDRLFGTLSPEYLHDFESATSAVKS